MRKSERVFWSLVFAVAAVAVVLRLTGADYGLPAVFNSDEPFHVDLAVSFGRGSLDPGVFKYPTLWMYTLFAAYGGYFLVWSGLGLLHTVRGFGELFARDPSGFYLIARLLAAAFSLAAVHRVFRAADLLGGRRLGLWAAALLAASPTLIVSAHAAKPESMMFFLSAMALYSALLYLRGGRPSALVLSGVWTGLAVSTQYTALPLVSVVLAAWWARPGRKPALLLQACAACACAFFLGSPYILLDCRAFLRDMADQMTIQRLGEPVLWKPFYRALDFAGHWAVGGLLLLAGAVRLGRRDRPLAAVLLAPVACQLLLLSASPEGGWSRYLMNVFPMLAVTAAFGVEELGSRIKRVPLGGGGVQAVTLAALMLPGAFGSWGFVRKILLPDTRTLAARWIVENVPEGTRILIDQEHASPRLTRTQEQVRRLLERSEEAHSPRWRYYDYLLSGHPGGGYEVTQVLRSPESLHSGQWHVRWSASGREVLDVRRGLEAVREAGIGVVVLSSVGATTENEPELDRFLRETEAEGVLLGEFHPVRGVSTGPAIRIYGVPRSRA